jgi:hypothetical protein
MQARHEAPGLAAEKEREADPEERALRRDARLEAVLDEIAQARGGDQRDQAQADIADEPGVIVRIEHEDQADARRRAPRLRRPRDRAS